MDPAAPHCPYHDHDGLMSCSRMHDVAFAVKCPQGHEEQVFPRGWMRLLGQAAFHELQS